MNLKTLYIECCMGAAGDMLGSALLELAGDSDSIVKELNLIGIPGVVFYAEKSVKCGISGTHMKVTVNGEEEISEDVHNDDKNAYCTSVHHHEHHSDHDHHHVHESNKADHNGNDINAHHHSTMNDIELIVSSLNVSEKIKSDVIAVYRIIAEAESYVHGKSVNDIHFHELGKMDAVADITAFCYLADKISPDRIISSPVCTGTGKVRCAHGILPVPAPATEYILRGVPVYGGRISGELCTPTGAALLRHFSDSYGSMPAMKVSMTGYGMGMKDFEQANCVRIFMGETDEKKDTVYELKCNIDDMTPEEVGFATEKLFETGALDVSVIPAAMKKNRPGIILNVICRENEKEKLISEIFRHTSTIGIREIKCERTVLDRTEYEKHTQYGIIKIKKSSGYGVVREKPEYDDIAEIAEKKGLSISEVLKTLEN